MIPLLPFQRECLQEIDRFDGRSLVALDPGLGKTLVALRYARARGLPCVVVCPAAIKYHWEREAKTKCGLDRVAVLEGTKPNGIDLSNAQVVILNYDILDGWLLKLREIKPQTVVIDECFPHDTLIMTEIGEVPIGDIVKHRLPLLVACWDHYNHIVCFRRVLYYNRKLRYSRLATIRHTRGKIVSTAEHKIWTENRGYVPAYCLSRGDCLWQLRDRISGLQSTKPATKALLQRMQTRICGQNLFNIPFGKETTRYVGEDEGKQSDDSSRYHSEDGGNEGTEWYIASLERKTWWKWSDNTSAEKIVGSIRQWMGIRASNSDWSKASEGGLLSHELQSGYCSHRFESSNRSGWSLPCEQECKEIRQEEAKSTNPTWVESIEIHESRNRNVPGCSSGDDPFVYNLEVEEYHNFFADGVLVKNCQYVANPKAIRSKLAKRLCVGVPNVLALSGTPLVNRPIELLTTLRILRPDVEEFQSKLIYGDRFCNRHLNHWGWDYRGASNTKELNRLLLDTCMVRRRKADVLPDLPPKVREVVPLGLSDQGQYDDASNDFLEWIRENDPERVRGAVKAEALVRAGYLLQLAARLKLQRVIEWITQLMASEWKAVVFCVHRKMVEALCRQLPWDSVVIDGSTTGRARQAAVDQFQADDKVRLAICNIIAGGTGLTLTAANTVVFAELDWRPGVHVQAEDRCHRIGTTEPVWAWYLVARGTIEERLCSILQEKQSVLSAVLDGGRMDSDLSVFDLLMAKEIGK